MEEDTKHLITLIRQIHLQEIRNLLLIVKHNNILHINLSFLSQSLGLKPPAQNNRADHPFYRIARTSPLEHVVCFPNYTVYFLKPP